MTDLLKKFYSESIKGTCTDSVFEFGNLHRKEYVCPFCINNKECHYNGECDRRDIPDQNFGWRRS